MGRRTHCDDENNNADEALDVIDDELYAAVDCCTLFSGTKNYEPHHQSKYELAGAVVEDATTSPSSSLNPSRSGDDGCFTLVSEGSVGTNEYAAHRPRYVYNNDYNNYDTSARQQQQQRPEEDGNSTDDESEETNNNKMGFKKRTLSKFGNWGRGKNDKDGDETFSSYGSNSFPSGSVMTEEYNSPPYPNEYLNTPQRGLFFVSDDETDETERERGRRKKKVSVAFAVIIAITMGVVLGKNAWSKKSGGGSSTAESYLDVIGDGEEEEDCDKIIVALSTSGKNFTSSSVNYQTGGSVYADEPVRRELRGGAVVRQAMKPLPILDASLEDRRRKARLLNELSNVSSKDGGSTVSNKSRSRSEPPNESYVRSNTPKAEHRQPKSTTNSTPVNKCSKVSSSTPSISSDPSEKHSGKPSVSNWPTSQPSERPSLTGQPSSTPSSPPSSQPSKNPSISTVPSPMPSELPTTSNQPTGRPSEHPSISEEPTSPLSNRPSWSSMPSEQPTERPSSSASPTSPPSETPSLTGQPSGTPSSQPSNQPSMSPSTSTVPSPSPSASPSASFAPSSPVQCDMTPKFPFVIGCGGSLGAYCCVRNDGTDGTTAIINDNEEEDHRHPSLNLACTTGIAGCRKGPASYNACAYSSSTVSCNIATEDCCKLENGGGDGNFGCIPKGDPCPTTYF